MSIEDKIKNAVDFMRNRNTDCSVDVCKQKGFCDETKSYTGMTFCKNSAEQIIAELNSEVEK